MAELSAVIEQICTEEPNPSETAINIIYKSVGSDRRIKNYQSAQYRSVIKIIRSINRMKRVRRKGVSNAHPRHLVDIMLTIKVTGIRHNDSSQYNLR